MYIYVYDAHTQGHEKFGIFEDDLWVEGMGGEGEWGKGEGEAEEGGGSLQRDGLERLRWVRDRLDSAIGNCVCLCVCVGLCVCVCVV